MDEYVEFGDHILVRSGVNPRILHWFPPCSRPLTFEDDQDAWRVETRIRFHLLICWECNP